MTTKASRRTFLKIGAAATVTTWLPAVPPASFSTLRTDADFGLSRKKKSRTFFVKGKPTEMSDFLHHKTSLKKSQI